MSDNHPISNNDLGPLTDDLQTLTRTSNPVGFIDLQIPALDAEATRTGLDTADLIAAATERITDDAVRRSAEKLFDISSRTESFTHRSRLAAEQMGISLDGFRRRSGGRPSRRDLVVVELARQIQQFAPANATTSEITAAEITISEASTTETRTTGTDTSRAGTDAPAIDDESHGPQPDTTVDETGVTEPANPSRRRRLPLAVIAALVIVAVGSIGVIGVRNYIRSVQADRIAELARDVPGDLDMSLYCVDTYSQDTIAEPQGSGWVCRNADDPSSSPMPIDPDEVCATQYGESTRAIALDDTAGAWRCELIGPVTTTADCQIAPGAFDASLADTMSPFAQGFRQRFERADDLPCPTSIMHRWADGILQELGSEGEQSALIALSPDTIVLLEGSAWAAFDRIKGITGSLVGYPLNEPEQRFDGVLVELSADGALFATSERATFHWLPPVVYQYWVEHGACLGPPVSDPYTNGDHFRQDFLNDSLVLNPSTVSFHTLGDC